MNFIKLVLLFIIFIVPLGAKDLEKVSLQLLWKHQFEFAGFYMAKEKGFYKDVNLDVELKEYSFGTNITNEVENGKSTFGIAYPNIILDKSNGANVVLLNSIYQSSPHILISLESSGINSISDFKNKRIMMEDNKIKTAPLLSMLYSQKINYEHINMIKPSYKIESLIDGKTDIFSAYISNEIHKLDQLKIKYNIWNPKDYGFDFYNDILFTSSKMLKNNPMKVKKFQEASLKGWIYAFENIDETINIILKKYNTQQKTKEALQYEAKTLKKLAYQTDIPLGHISKNKVQRIYDMYNLMGLTINTIDLDNFIYTPKLNNLNLTLEEQKYISLHPTLTVHNELNWPPYNFNINGKPIGFSIEYMNLLASKLNIDINYISGPSWSDFITKIQNDNLDIMLNIRNTKKRQEFLNFTTKYIESSKSIFTDLPNIKTLEDLNGKTVAVPKDFFIHKFLEKNYPKIKLNIQKNALQCLVAVIERKADAIVADYSVTKYLMQENGLTLKYVTVTQNKQLTTKMTIATSLKNPMLRDILQKAMDKVTSEEMNKLKNKWLGTSYKKSKSLKLTKEEENYILEKRIIKMCNNPNWEPLEFAQNGNLNNMQGIAIDTIKLLEKKLDVKFENVATKSWSQSQEFLKEKRCDILPCAIETSKRKEYANFTKPYLNLPLAIFTTKDKSVVSGLDEIMDKSWTRQKGSGLITKLRKEYPNMKIIETKGDKEALQYVNSDKAYFTIATLPVASHVISKYMLNDLHIAGYTGMVYNLSMAVQDNDKILLNILNKALTDISKEESKQIMRKWVGSSVKEPVADYKIIKQIFIVVFIVILLLVYRQYVLNKANKDLQTRVDSKTKDLQDLNENLELKVKQEVEKNINIQKKLFNSEKMAAMGEMIGNIAHQWRQPLSVISTGATGIQIQKKYNILTDEFLDETCDAINSNAQYLSRTIDDFRNFIKGDREETSFSLSQNITSFLHLIEGSIKSNQLKMKLDLEDNIVLIGYPNELIQCFINIFNNSKDILKDMDEDYRFIFISSFIKDGNVIIQFKDNAGGIPTHILPKIFDPYFTTKHKSQGTGLGLHMTYSLVVEGMNGTIEVQNVSYKYDNVTYNGAQFEISLPLNKSKN